MKRALSFLLVLCMVVAMLPTSAYAETPEPISGGTEYLSGQDEIVQAIRQGLVNREETITVDFLTDTWDETCGSAFMDAALAHTGVPTEGDYLQWHLAGYEAELTGYAVEDFFYITVTYRVSYYTSAEQEAEVTEQAAALLQELNPSGSDYEKIKCVYDWMCRNIVYDHANLEDDAYTLKFSAYAALIDKTAVCQGYALLLYRLALEMGIDCRIITGVSHDEAHAWNIVCLDGRYYNLDATWDAELSVYQYFLKCESGFVGHTRAEEYTTEFFHAAYPMASEDYVPDDMEWDFLASGVTTCGQVWTLTHDGVLSVSGTGSVEPAWKDYRNEIRKIVVSEGITALEGFFSGYTKLTEVELPGTVEDLGAAQFSECLTLETVRLSEGTKSIGMFCFDGCVSLKNINFPSTLETIDDEAFRNTGLESVVVSCPEIGRAAFTGCRSLREVILEDGVVSIGELVFAYNPALETIALPSTLASIGAYAFYECTSLSSPITIPEGIITLGEVTFFRCEKLEDIYLPSTLRSIGNGAFQYSGITSLTIPDSVESIGNAAFYGCSKLQSLDLGSGVKHIGAAFFVCGIPSLHLPASVETIDTTLWSYSMMAEVTVDADNPYFTAVDGILYNKDMTEIIFCPPKWEGELVIPDTVCVLADGVFSGCSNITTIVIPDSVTSFGTNIFEGCGANTVVLPNGMETIPDNMFNQCGSLVSVVLPDSITAIGEGAFRGCLSLESLHIPAEVSFIGEETFAGCHTLQLSVDAENPNYTMLDGVLYTKDMKVLCFATRYAPKEFIVPDGVEVLQNCSFDAHEELERIVLADSVTHIGEYAFSGLCELTGVVFGTGLESIGNSAFYYCQNLKDLVFADATFSIGVEAFGDCDSLTSIVIPGTVTRIDNVAFWHCEALANVEIGSITEKVGGNILKDTFYYNNPDNWGNGGLYLSNWLIAVDNDISGAFVIPEGTCGIADSTFGERGITAVMLPASVKYIGNGAFANCQSLETVNFSYGLEQIGDLAFANCRRLGALTIPASVTYIGWQFWVGQWNCDPNALVFLGDAPEFHEQAFMNIMPTVVYYPDGLDSWTTIADSQFGAGEYSVEDSDGNVTTYPSISWKSYTAAQCTDHYWAMSQRPHNCEEGGEIEYTCLLCQGTCTETVAPSEHSLSETISAATCTEGAYLTRDCTICEYVCVEYLMDAKGHSYGEWYTTMDSLCTWDGERWRECSYCGYVEIEILAAHGHNYESWVTDPTCVSWGYTTHTCSLCGDSYVDSYVDAKGHSYGNWYTVTDATCTKDGQQRRDCADCDHYETRVIESKGHSYSSVVTAPTCTAQGYTTHTCACGDSYVDSYVEPTDHEYVGGICVCCGHMIVQLGDVNGDGEIDILDANLVVTYYNEIASLTEEQLKAADVNGDGEVDIMDANMIVAYYNEIIDSFP